jgi:hypothetical protein
MQAPEPGPAPRIKLLQARDDFRNVHLVSGLYGSSEISVELANL